MRRMLSIVCVCSLLAGLAGCAPRRAASPAPPMGGPSSGPTYSAPRGPAPVEPVHGDQACGDGGKACG